MAWPSVERMRIFGVKAELRRLFHSAVFNLCQIDRHIVL